MTSELPDVWVRFDDFIACPTEAHAHPIGAGGHRYVPASRLEALEARNARLVEALRNISVGWHEFRDEEWQGCLLCREPTGVTGDERHAPGCLLADSEAEKQNVHSG